MLEEGHNRSFQALSMCRDSAGRIKIPPLGTEILVLTLPKGDSPDGGSAGLVGRY